jgi:hypothetical protein
VRRANKPARHFRYQRGLSLFEIVVSICAIVILYMVAEQRLNDLPAAAERASFHAVLEQIKTGVKMEMISRIAGGRLHEVQMLEGTNPMNFLLETPSNYGGELVTVTDAVRRRNAWYFETSTGQLVYVVGGSSIDDVVVSVAGVPVRMGQIRLRLASAYGSAGGAPVAISVNAGGNWEGLMLVPVNEYAWDRRAEQTLSAN